jgi:ABC-type multidrug transport system permease subunit
MNQRAHATSVLARRRILETLISPGFYVAQTIGLLLAYLLVAGFVRAIDSSGFDYQLNPAYELIGRSLVGAFGATFVEKLFSEGPFLFILYIAFLPVLLYLAVSSVFRIGLEKKVGAMELLAYGPADGTSYFLASLIKDILMTAIYLVLLYLFLLIAALLNNLILGPSFYYSLIVLFFLSIAVYAYGAFASSLTDNSASAIAVFLGLVLFFFIIMMGSFTIVSGYVRNLSSMLAWIIKWISPLFYLDLALRYIQVGNWGMYLVGNLLLLVLAAVVLLITHVTINARGVRS